MPDFLDWPLEAACQNPVEQRWTQAGSNICLDFHGDPIRAELVVYSDGNHHMALEACLQCFRQQHPDVIDIFYATTPPSVIVNLQTNGQLILGNLTISRLPHIFISPVDVMNRLQADNCVTTHKVFMQSRGNVLLVKKGNPKKIQGVADLLRDDVRLFISNPVREKASYDVYAHTLLGLAKEEKIDVSILIDLLNGSSSRLITGDHIHHREAPQCLFENRADIAIVYHHLALRFARIFPEHFEFIPLGGTKENPQPSTKNICTGYHIGLVEDGGKWGEAFVDFMFSNTVTKLYAEHGLQRP